MSSELGAAADRPTRAEARDVLNYAGVAFATLARVEGPIFAPLIRCVGLPSFRTRRDCSELLRDGNTGYVEIGLWPLVKVMVRALSSNEVLSAVVHWRLGLDQPNRTIALTNAELASFWRPNKPWHELTGEVRERYSNPIEEQPKFDWWLTQEDTNVLSNYCASEGALALTDPNSSFPPPRWMADQVDVVKGHFELRPPANEFYYRLPIQVAESQLPMIAGLRGTVTDRHGKTIDQ